MSLIAKARAYSREHLEDAPEISDWVWTEIPVGATGELTSGPPSAQLTKPIATALCRWCFARTLRWPLTCLGVRVDGACAARDRPAVGSTIPFVARSANADNQPG